MADQENNLPETPDGIYFAVPRRIFEDELIWNFPDKRPGEKQVPAPEPEPEQNVPSLRNDHPKLMDHFGPDVDEYLLKCSLDKFENQTVASFRKDVITQLSAKIERNSRRSSTKRLDSSSSEEDFSSAYFRNQKFTPVQKSSMGALKQKRSFQKGSGDFLPKTQGFLKTDVADTVDRTRPEHNDDSTFIKNKQQIISSVANMTNDEKIKNKSTISKNRGQEADLNWICLRKNSNIKSGDRILLESLHKNDLDEVEIPLVMKREGELKSGQENLELGSRQNDNLTQTCLQESPKAKTTDIISVKSGVSDSNSIDSLEDLRVENKSYDSIHLKATLKVCEIQVNEFKQPYLRTDPEITEDNGSIESQCQRIDPSVSRCLEDLSVKKDSVISIQLRENLNVKTEKMSRGDCQKNNLCSTGVQKDFKVESKKINGDDDSKVSLNLRKNKRYTDSEASAGESQCEEVTLLNVKNKQLVKLSDATVRKGPSTITDADLTSALQILKAKSSDILGKQCVFLHSMINEPLNSTSKFNLSPNCYGSLYEEENQKKVLIETEEKIENETKEGRNEYQTTHGVEKEKDHDDEKKLEDKRNVQEVNEERADEVKWNEVKGEAMKYISNEALNEEESDEDKEREKMEDEIRKCEFEVLETNKVVDYNEEDEKNTQEVSDSKNEIETTNEGKENIPESDSLITPQQVAVNYQIQTSDSDSANIQTSGGNRETGSESPAWEPPRDLPTATIKDTDEHSSEKDKIYEGARPKCLPRTSKSLPNKTFSGALEQIHENYKFFREKNSRFFVSDVIIEEDEADALSKISDLSRCNRLKNSEVTPTPLPRNVKYTEELSSDVLIISVSDEDSNETIKTIVNVKKPGFQRSPEMTPPLSGPASESCLTSTSFDPTDWAKFLSQDSLVDSDQNSEGKGLEWDSSPSTESSSSLWLSCSEDDRQANLLNYDLFRTDFSEADPDLNTNWPFSNNQSKDCFNVFYSECYALHL